MKTLATQFQLLKENKGNKDVFLKTAKTKYPSYVPQSATFNEAVNILKQKGIINENIIDLAPINTNVAKKESFELAFSSFLKEAKKKDTVENTIDKTDKKNPDNLIFDQIMAGCYVEAKNVKNKDKSIDEIKDIVVKNLSKDPIYYTKNAAFKVDGLGYKDDAPGLGIPKEAKGKYKSSGYGDIDKKFLNENKQINESYGSNSDFDGTGLVVVGRTQLDNNEIQDMMDETDYYGIWNAREGYWFFPEAEETLDALETELEAQFISRGINARFEAQFGEDGIDYDDENFSDPLIDGEEDLFEYEKNSDFGGTGLIVVGRTKIDNNLIDQAIEESGFYGIFNARENYWFFPEGKETIDRLENELETIFIKKGINARFEGQFNESLNKNKSHSIIKNMSENILTAKNYKDFYLFESENEKPTESQLSKMKDKLESYVNKVGNASEAVSMYLKRFPQDKKYKNVLMTLAEPLF